MMSQASKPTNTTHLPSDPSVPSPSRLPPSRLLQEERKNLLTAVCVTWMMAAEGSTIGSTLFFLIRLSHTITYHISFLCL